MDDALEAIGFGPFQWKISFLTGLSWVIIPIIIPKVRRNDFLSDMQILHLSLVDLPQVADAMEMMILSILGPQLHCEWKLPSYKVALITSVKSLLPFIAVLQII